MKSVCGFSRSAVCPLTIALQNIFPWLGKIKMIFLLLFQQFDFVVFANCFSFVNSTNSISDLQQTKIEH